jgi:hypothetical protein
MARIIKTAGEPYLPEQSQYFADPTTAIFK